MKHFLLWLLWLPLAARALPHLELDVSLDPATRQLDVRATLSDEHELRSFRLGREYEVTALQVNGRPHARSSRPASAEFPLPAGARRVELAYRATLPPTPTLDHRQVLGQRGGTAGQQGSFLPASAGWYPDPGVPFSYRAALRLPAGQKGLVPGELREESESSAGYRAVFDFPHPAEGIDLMAGPYVVRERALEVGARTIRIRTWFHPELQEFAQPYLDDSARYIARYSQLIGAYPFCMFSIVSSPTPTGYGMPSLTYLGREVIRLPFIRATSLGHEVLHNWWGNGVYPDWRSGNWSEGLTTFLADYAYKEDAGADAAREMRLGWLRNLAAVPPGEDSALKDFTARRHGISSIIGYDKAAMVFLMLRDEIGKDAFERGLRLFWERKRFREAGWADLEAAFAQAAGRPLRGFFRQWVDRPGAPALRLKSAAMQGGQLELGIEQNGGYALEIPLRLGFADHTETRKVRTTGRETKLAIDNAAGAQTVELDPDYRLWRRVDPATLPAILREVFVAPRAALVLLEVDANARTAALALAARVLDAKPVQAEDGAAGLPGSAPALVIGPDAAADVWLARHGLPPRPAAAHGSAQVWTGRDAGGRPYAVVAARDPAALAALARPLPHYGSQSWLAFDGARAIDKGVWPPRSALLQVRTGASH